MFLGDVIRVLARRWFVLGVGLLATGYLGWYVVGHVGTDYQASGQMVLLLPPEASGVTTPMNPYLNLSGGLSTVGALAAAHVMTQDAELELAKDGFTAEYDVALSPGTGPLLVITARDKDGAQAIATRDAVMTEIARAVATMQQDLAFPNQQVISTQQSSVSRQAEVLPGSRLRALAGTVGASLLVLLVIIFALDRAVAEASQERSRSRRGSSDGSDGGLAVDDGGADPQPAQGRDRVMVG